MACSEEYQVPKYSMQMTISDLFSTKRKNRDEKQTGEFQSCMKGNGIFMLQRERFNIYMDATDTYRQTSRQTEKLIKRENILIKYFTQITGEN